jgi:hypothetical protein
MIPSLVSTDRTRLQSTDSVRQQAKGDAANDGAAVTGVDEQSGRGTQVIAGVPLISVSVSPMTGSRPEDRRMTSQKYAVSTAWLSAEPGRTPMIVTSVAKAVISR